MNHCWLHYQLLKEQGVPRGERGTPCQKTEGHV